MRDEGHNTLSRLLQKSSGNVSESGLESVKSIKISNTVFPNLPHNEIILLLKIMEDKVGREKLTVLPVILIDYSVIIGAKTRAGNEVYINR